ncbi:NYN domain-containing protein [Angustibacter sp. Root456]|uniref:NYN domain-containing protein n=1 Tax=Angustibacter sp. Root456 TaxID=1736539 RepID=UPI0009ECA171|nr:NYN domain-containing protein [Angustibacter sp. Root456]
MSDDGTHAPASTDAEAPSTERPELDLLVWDAPNIDMTLSNVIGAKPSPTSRPRFDAIARWLVQAAGDRDVEGSVFANIPPAAATTMRGWIEALRSFGYAVFAKPKIHSDDDVDLDMLAHISDRARTHRLVRLIVASGDGRNFLEPLEDLARAGVQVVVLSFSEVAGYALESDLLTFVDLEDVPGAFITPLERVRLDALPPEGAWLRPTRSLRDVADG